MEETAAEQEEEEETGKRVEVVQLGTKLEEAAAAAAACSSINEDGSPSEVVIDAIFGRYTFCFESLRTVVTSEQLLLPSV